MVPFQIHKRPRLTLFIVLSCLIHALALFLQNFLPPPTPEVQSQQPVKVKFIEPQPVIPEPPTFIDSPEPERIEKPQTSKLLSSFDSKAHSDQDLQKKRVYSKPETKIPKSVGEISKPPKKIATTHPKRQATKPKKAMKKNRSFPLKKKKKGLPVKDETEEEDSPTVPKNLKGSGLLALLDGFDASKYASIDTDSFDPNDDDEPISLDTQETKYADYFARIKHQIEQVWTYPLEAARRGISGEITLRFRISKDGNLLGVRLTDGSGTEALDMAALKAVKMAAPYYPFPVTITKERITILATFIYSPTYNSKLHPY